MFNFFKKIIPGSNLSSSDFPPLNEIKDDTIEYTVELFLFNLLTGKWTESIPSSLFIEIFGKPHAVFIIVKTEAPYPCNFVRKITRDIKLILKDERTWMLRASVHTKSSDYKECNIIACRFVTSEIAKKFNDSIKYVQSTQKLGFDNLNFRLQVIRKKHKKELLEKEAALFSNFPSWHDLTNGKYYQSFYNKEGPFQCKAEVREFDFHSKKWKELVLGTVKIEIFEDTEQKVLTVIENDDFIRREITSDIELLAIDDRTRMWRGYKKCKEDVKSCLIGCRFISSKVAESFMESVMQLQTHASIRCAFRDEYISKVFEKNYVKIFDENQAALQTNFPGEYEITELEDDSDSTNGPNHQSSSGKNQCLPSTSREGSIDIDLIDKSKKFHKTVSSISLASFSMSSDKNSLNHETEEILCEYKADFFHFDSDTKKWIENNKGTIKILRNAEIPKILIKMKTEKLLEEFCSTITSDFQLFKKDSNTYVWKATKNGNSKNLFFASEFENSENAEEFENSVKNIQKTYSSELSNDEVELGILKKLYETESEESLAALGTDMPLHVDLSWLHGPSVSKFRTNEEMSESHFSKGALFCHKADLYKFESNTREWKRLTALPGLVSIKRKQFQEFQKTLIYAITDEFEGRVIIKCEIGQNYQMELKTEATWMWRGYVEAENGNLKSLLIACRFTNSEIAKSFKKSVEEVQKHAPWRCFVRDEFLARILKRESEKNSEESTIALNSSIEKEMEATEGT